MVASQDARADADFGLKGVGGEAGFVSPENVNGTFGFGAFADLGTIAPRVQMSTHLDYWSHSEGLSGVADASVRDITLSVRSAYMFPVSSPTVQPYAGGGLGMHLVNAKVEIPGLPTMEDSSTKLGVDLLGGLSMPMNPSTNFMVEGVYGIVSDVSQFSLKAGVEFKLGSSGSSSPHGSTRKGAR
jgi:opacity protein-like surface antigen